MSKKLKPRDKITQKMSRDGLIEVNETAGTAELVSGREQDADFSKQPEQAAQEAAQQLPHPSGGAAARPHTPELSPKRDDAAAERVLEHIDAAHNRAAPKKAIKRAQREAAAKTKTSRLQFTEEERATPELQKAIRKSERAADRLDEARAAIPKKKVLTKERTFDEAAGKGKTRLRFEEKEKPIPGGRQQHNLLSRPVQEIGVFIHNKIHSVEKDNSGVEGAHKSEELAERGIRAGARQVRKSRRSRKLKPYRATAKAEKAAFMSNETNTRTATPTASPLTAQGTQQPVMVKRIGKTTYRVKLHFSETSKETMTDKIKRLILNDCAKEFEQSEKNS